MTFAFFGMARTSDHSKPEWQSWPTNRCLINLAMIVLMPWWEFIGTSGLWIFWRWVLALCTVISIPVIHSVKFNKSDASLGNDYLSSILRNKQYILRINMASWEGKSAYADFSDFNVNNSSDSYRLVSLGNYSGNAGADYFLYKK